MMIKYGPYILEGLIAVLAIGLAILVGFMLYNSMQEKKAKKVRTETPRADTIADQIKDQFKAVDKERERRIYTQSGASVVVKPARSVFSFGESDAEKGISLESEFENGMQAPFIRPDEQI